MTLSPSHRYLHRVGIEQSQPMKVLSVCDTERVRENKRDGLGGIQKCSVMSGMLESRGGEVFRFE